MSEYEFYEVIVGFTGNLEQSMAVLISLLSAYLILAYTIGEKLSRFQVIFISTCFTLVYIGILQAQIYYLDQTVRLAEKLESLQGEPSIVAGQGDISIVAFVIVRIAFLIGSLYFMWNVRHTIRKQA